MTTPVLVYLHGWGFDASLWDAVRAALAARALTVPPPTGLHLGPSGAVVIDLGFFGPPSLPTLPRDRPVIAVGHSLGVLWLLATARFEWAGLVAINGFDRFCAGPDFGPAVAPRPLQRMIDRLERDPIAVVEQFRRRCGCDQPLPGPPAIDRLREGLLLLRDGDARAAVAERGAPILALSGGADPILPPGMEAICFRTGRPVTRARRDGGGHLLPLTDPGWCAAQIAGWLERMGPEGSAAV